MLALYYRFDVRGQNRLMVIAGSIFYAAFDWRFLALLYLSTLVDFFVGRGLEQADDGRRRKVLVAISLVVQLGILGVFKYFNFFADGVAEVLGRFGISPDPLT